MPKFFVVFPSDSSIFFFYLLKQTKQFKELGFCWKCLQVDLKLKVCRGTSIKKILVREAKSYSATKVIVGTARNHNKIRSSTSVAKYCAKKLAKECGVLAVNNGKVVFKREGPSETSDHQQGFKIFTEIGALFCDFSLIMMWEFLVVSDVHAGNEDHRRNGLLAVFQRSLNNPSVEQNNGNANRVLKDNKNDDRNHQTLEQCLAKAVLESTVNVAKENCSICTPASSLPDKSCNQSAEESSSDGGEDKSMALVPVERVNTATGSISLLVRELPENRPGWPLLRSAVLPDRQDPERSMLRKIPVVQWAMQLPSRYPSSIPNLEQRQFTCGPAEERSSNINGESGAIVLVGTETVHSPPSSEHKSKNLPQELEGLHDKYSSTCRLFNYQDLLSATSNFLAGLFLVHIIHV